MTLMLLLMCALGCATPADTASAADTVTVHVEYSVQVTEIPVLGHFMAGPIGWLFQRLGAVPTNLEYTKTSIDSAGVEKSFVIDFRGRSGRRWIHVSSDTTQPSSIDPPEFKKGISNAGNLNSDGVRFTRDIQNFFHRADSTEWSGSFVFHKKDGKKDTLTFYIFRSPLDTADTTYRRFSPKMYWMMSFNGQGRPYLSSKVRVGVWKGRTIYLWTDVRLDQESKGIILKIEHLRIK